ncbi:hypothetical protein MKS88_002280 [Plasmodium brasilianum]|uniref:Uncharacterized protein n=1 Tax=Plasmodium brasilianum TaxID=5824 RepID=A0ACB9YAI6_PLABR|nr:hypothetical protein MKS88_002280 [Plasmodium brasilianum]
MIRLRYILFCKNILKKYKENEIVNKNITLLSKLKTPGHCSSKGIDREKGREEKLMEGVSDIINEGKKEKKKLFLKKLFFVALLFYSTYESIDLLQKNKEYVKKKLGNYLVLYDIIEIKIIPQKIIFDKMVERMKECIMRYMKYIQGLNQYYNYIKLMITECYNNVNIFFNIRVKNILELYPVSTSRKGINNNVPNFTNTKKLQNMRENKTEKEFLPHNNEINKSVEQEIKDKPIDIYLSDSKTNPADVHDMSNDIKNVESFINKLNISNMKEERDDEYMNNEKHTKLCPIDYNDNSYNSISNNYFTSSNNTNITGVNIEREDDESADILKYQENIELEKNFRTAYDRSTEPTEKTPKEENNKIYFNILPFEEENIPIEDHNIKGKELERANCEAGTTFDENLPGGKKGTYWSASSVLEDERFERNPEYVDIMKGTCEAIENNGEHEVVMTFKSQNGRDAIADSSADKEAEGEGKKIFTFPDGDDTYKELDREMLHSAEGVHKNVLMTQTERIIHNMENCKERCGDDNEIKEHTQSEHTVEAEEVERESEYLNNFDNMASPTTSNSTFEGTIKQSSFNKIFEKDIKNFVKNINNLNKEELKCKMIEMFINELITEKYKDILMEEEKWALKKILTIKYNNNYLRMKKKLQKELKRSMIKKLKEEEKVLRENYKKEKENFENHIMNRKQEEINMEKDKLEKELTLVQENYLKKMNIYAFDINRIKEIITEEQLKQTKLESINYIQNQIVNLQNCIIQDLSVESALLDLKKCLERDTFLEKVFKVLPYNFFSRTFKPTSNNNEKIKNEFLILYKQSVKEAFLEQQKNSYFRKIVSTFMSYLYINHQSTLNKILMHTIKENTILKANLLNLSYALNSIEQNNFIDALQYIDDLTGNCKKTFNPFNEHIKNVILFKFYLRLAVSRLILTSKTLRSCP